jgi:O-antigen ligase
LVGLSFAPFIYGANVPLAWGVNGLVFGFLLTLFVIVHAISGRPLPVPLRRYCALTVMFAIIFVWIFLQTQPWMPAALHAPVWQEAGEMLGRNLPGTISIDPGATTLGLLRLGTSAAVFLFALHLGRDPRWATRIVLTIAVAGTVYAFFAMVFKALGPELSSLIIPRALVNPDPAYTGPFINRDHFAIYVGIATVCAWAALVTDLASRKVPNYPHDYRDILANLLALAATFGRYVVLLVPLAIALLLTVSRAGFLLTATAVLMIAVLTANPMNAYQAHGGSRVGKRPALLRLKPVVPMAIAVLGILIALVAHGDSLTGRLANSTVEGDLQPRFAVARATLRAISSRPLLGYGYGTFASAFPPYRDETIEPGLRWTEAHNSYLEALLGLGVPVALILFASLATIVLSCARGVIMRKRDRLSPIAAMAATFIVALHALIDFSIQIEGIALTYAALLGAGFAQSWSTRET